MFVSTFFISISIPEYDLIQTVSWGQGEPFEMRFECNC